MFSIYSGFWWLWHQATLIWRKINREALFKVRRWGGIGFQHIQGSTYCPAANSASWDLLSIAYIVPPNRLGLLQSMLCILLAAAHEGPQGSYNARQFLLHLFVHPLGVSWADARLDSAKDVIYRIPGSGKAAKHDSQPGNDSGSTPRIVAGCLIEPVVGMRAIPPNKE